MSAAVSFLLGFVLCLAILVAAAFVRRRRRRRSFIGEADGPNSRQAVEENIVAVINAGTKEKRVIDGSNWWQRLTKIRRQS